MDVDVIVVGAGLAGLVGAVEIADEGQRALVVDRGRRKASVVKPSGRSAAFSLEADI